MNAPTGPSAPASGATYNSWRFNNAGSYTINPTGNVTIATGGILETSNVGANAVSIDTAGTSDILASGNGQDLIVIQNNAAAPMTINSVINGASSALGLTKSGAGTLNITAVNSYTGPTSVNAGTLALTSSSALLGNTAIAVAHAATFAFSLALLAATALAREAPSELAGVGTGSIFSMQVGGNIETLNVGKASINGATLDFDLSNSSGADELLASTASATGTNTINIAAPASGTLTASPQTLISAPAAERSPAVLFNSATARPSNP